MKKFTMFACLALALVFALASYADDLPQFTKGNSTLYGGSTTFAKAGGDTINLMSSSDDPTNTAGEPIYVGDFEMFTPNTPVNGAKAFGWGSTDITKPLISHYQVSDYQQVGGNLAAWCGDINIPSCDDSLDPDGGYANSWHDQIEFTASVTNPGVSANVTITATLQNDTEPGYDFTYLSYQYNNQTLADITSWDGKGTVAVNGSVTYLPIEYMGGDQIRVLFRFKSDGGWSDGDCAWPTAGANQIDDINVLIEQAGETDQNFFEDFEGGDLNLGDGLGDPGSYLWRVALPDGVGDFAQIWEGLEDVDPCNTNYTKQVAFIDDGVIVPGTGGSDCINWCYGPAGYIVNTTGGLAGPSEHIYNTIESPVMDWPNDNFDGIIYSFGVYRHEDLSSDAPGMFYVWAIRSADTDDSAGNGAQVIEDMPWSDRNFVYYGGPDYIRATDNSTDLMEPGRDQVQVQAGVYELGYAWGWTGNDGYPAPYLDNFKVQVFPYIGPGIATREIDLANDGFPARGDIDFGDLGSHSVRFDMARNISLASHLNVDFGDTMVVDIVPVRAGAVLNGAPVMHYTIDANPVFDPYRTAPTTGTSVGMPAVGASGIADPDAWAFDLPDTGCLMPGDVLEYYIYAEDVVGGDIQSATLPGDISEYGDFSSPLAYNSTYTIHALPTINFDGFTYSTPPVLFWNDFANRGGENEWYTALNNAGKVRGVDYDIYYTNGPSSGVGNGLGGRAGSYLNLEHYTDMLYTAGDLSINTISNGDFNNDSSDDVGVLSAWLNSGGKDLFMTGDDLASDLVINGGTLTQTFAETWMGISFQQQDIRSFIDNQAAPVVMASIGNPVFQNLSSWVSFGGCPGINTFDGVEVAGSAQMLAEFTDPAGQSGAYTFSAGTLNIPTTPGTTRVVSLPYDFMYVNTDTGAKSDAPIAARSQMLRDVLSYFGLPFVPGNVTGTPELQKFAARNYPNPFNPSTKIFYTMPKAGHLTLKVYSVRGELVKTLINGQVKAGEDFVVWDGTNNQGGNVSSGVYFYEARTGADVIVNKMALVK